MNASVFCLNAIDTLTKSQNYAEDFVQLHREFYDVYHEGIVFSTSLYQDGYFETILYWLGRGDFPDDEDKNFTSWLKIARQMK